MLGFYPINANPLSADAVTILVFTHYRVILPLTLGITQSEDFGVFATQAEDFDLSATQTLNLAVTLV